MEFVKYQHIERFGTDEVDGIDLGNVYVFPKIDGTNGSVWFDNGEIKCSSRRLELIDHDNGGFKEYILSDPRIKEFFKTFSDMRLFGEWLIPHSLKTYRQDAWRKFYIFDIMKWDGNYLAYDEYKPWLDRFGLEYIPPIAIAVNPNYEGLKTIIEKNMFLIEDGKGIGEGIVLKNYEYKNKYGRTTWAKIVTNEFKEKHSREMGAPIVKSPDLIEENIINNYCTESMIDKVLAKIKTECGGWSSAYILRLLNTVYHDLISEESWNFVKEYKNPRVNFKTLQQLCFRKIKEIKPDLF